MILGCEAISWVSECKYVGVHNFTCKTHCCRGDLNCKTHLFGFSLLPNDVVVVKAELVMHVNACLRSDREIVKVHTKWQAT